MVLITRFILSVIEKISANNVKNVIVDDGGNPHTIRTKTAVKYLEDKLDNKLNFWEQFQRLCEKAESVASSFSRLMANIGGPKSGKRKLLMSVVNSVLIYGSEIWADTTKIGKYTHIH